MNGISPAVTKIDTAGGSSSSQKRISFSSFVPKPIQPHQSFAKEKTTEKGLATSSLSSSPASW
jgi:hypothetical protein